MGTIRGGNIVEVRLNKCGCIAGKALCAEAKMLYAAVETAVAAGDQAGYWRALKALDEHMKKAGIRKQAADKDWRRR